MTETSQGPRAGMARRDFLTTSAAAAAVGFGASRPVLAQAAPTPAPAPSLPAPGTVVVERLKGGIMTMAIDRPEAQNRIDAPTLIALGKAIYQLEHDDELRVAVLFGKGENFASGLDALPFFAAVRAGEFPPKDRDYLPLLNFPQPPRTKPLVVAVHGSTRTVGHEMFLAADLRVAASNTVFAQDEVTLGVFPLGGATIRFTREAGWGNAMRYMLTGDTWTAEEAYRLGLVQAVTPPGKQLDRALEFAQKIAEAAPLGVRATLASARQAIAGEETAFAALRAEGARIRQSADTQEYRNALKEHRKPVYQGR